MNEIEQKLVNFARTHYMNNDSYDRFMADLQKLNNDCCNYYLKGMYAIPVEKADLLNEVLTSCRNIVPKNTLLFEKLTKVIPI